MARDTFAALQSLNDTLLDRRWTDEELQDLVMPRFGVVSSFASMSRHLAQIRAKDLGDTPPAVAVSKAGM